MNNNSSSGVDLREAFKVSGMKGSGAGSGNNMDYAAMGVGGLGALSSSGNNARCPLNDNSMMCVLSRTVSITSMVIYLLVVFIVIMFILYTLYGYTRRR